MGATLSLCCKEVGAEEEILLPARFDALHVEGLVLVSLATGDEPCCTPEALSPRSLEPDPQIRDDRDRGRNKAQRPNRDFSEAPAPSYQSPTGLEGLTPKGEYITCAEGFGAVDALEMANLERLVARLAGSPLGCLDFENTFRTRQAENHIVVLKDHDLDSATFGEVCSQYSKVTILGLRNAAGKAIWAPAPYIRLHSSDQIMLIECTPFALAMGLANGASLAQSSMSPPKTPPGYDHRMNRGHDTPFQDLNNMPDKVNRRCCGV